jgi:hypothetical protein
MPYDGSEKRRNPRQAFTDNIEFCLSSRSPDSNKTFLGACVNINEFGMCIYTFDCVNEGETIEIKTTLPVPYDRAEVRWVKTYSGNFYKVGLMFIA